MSKVRRYMMANYDPELVPSIHGGLVYHSDYVKLEAALQKALIDNRTLKSEIKFLKQTVASNTVLEITRNEP